MAQFIAGLLIILFNSTGAKYIMQQSLIVQSHYYVFTVGMITAVNKTQMQ
jgi:hypothetical protein